MADEEDPPSLMEEIYGTAEQELVARVKEEELISVCMNALGWDYVASVDQSPSLFIADGSDPEERKVSGYGLVDSQIERSQLMTNPNRAYIDSLSPEEVEAYNQDLYGDQVEATSDRASISVPTSTGAAGGCAGEAQKVAYKDLPYYFDFSISAALGQLEDEIENDDRSRRAVELWAKCMRGLGYEYASPSEIIAELLDEFNSGVNPDEVRSKEIQLAEVDYSCRAGDVDQLLSEARAEHEGEFRADYLESAGS